MNIYFYFFLPFFWCLSFSLVVVMVNFFLQWVLQVYVLDVWPNIIVGVSVRVVLDEVNIYISRLSKADGPPG